jgi:hypothetical protein
MRWVSLRSTHPTSDIPPFSTPHANAVSPRWPPPRTSKKAVEQLAPRELARFRAWFEAFDAQQFDAAIEQDIRTDKLDAHAEEALAAHRAGRSREL